MLDLHLDAFQKRLPFFHRYDHTNYTRGADVRCGSIPVSTVLRKSVRIFRIQKNRYVYIFNKSELQVESRQDPKTVPTTASATLKEINHTMYPNITECLRILSTLPVTTCECERNVSALRLLITYLRSTI